MKVANFLVIANKRCGTSWLNANLSEHPEIFMTKHKGVHFFDKDVEKGIDHYSSFFADATNEKMRGETEHSYFWDDDVPQRIYNTLGIIPMILSLRHPVDRAYSYFQLIHRKDPTFSGDFKEYFYHEKNNNGKAYAWGKYGEQLQKYLKYFPLKTFHIINFENINLDPQQTIKDTYKFLNVDPEFIPSLLNHHWTKATNLPEHINPVIKKIFYTSKYATFIRRVLRKLSFKQIQLYRSFSPTSLDITLKKALTKYYDEDIQLLTSITNTDFSSWLSSSI